tara:strand:- start:1760 stop:2098 length:339 start_codon:yes stop_codon:yes gene_type:complete
MGINWKLIGFALVILLCIVTIGILLIGLILFGIPKYFDWIDFFGLPYAETASFLYGVTITIAFVIWIKEIINYRDIYSKDNNQDFPYVAPIKPTWEDMERDLEKIKNERENK